MKVLHLTLKKKWFDMIESGEKVEEYREVKPYWVTRLEGREYDVVRFRNGYSKDARVMVVELLGIGRGLGVLRWGAPELECLFVLRLGKVLEVGGSSE